MHILIAGKQYTLDNFVGRGGEGEVYRLMPDLAAKKYFSNQITRERQLKVLALCNSYSSNSGRLGVDKFAFPQAAAYSTKENLDELCGFSMKFFDRCPAIDQVRYDLSTNEFREVHGVKLRDDHAVELIYKIFEVADYLHKCRIVLGDVNPENVLYNPVSRTPVIIDVDSAQVGQFRCLSYSENYLDPLIEQQGKNSQGSYTYSAESDVFSLSCVAFEFLLGAHPYFISTDPINQIVQNKEQHISRLTVFEGLNLPGRLRYTPRAADTNIDRRLASIRTLYPKLYAFFADVFLRDSRASLVQTLERSDPRHPAYVFYTQSGFDTALQFWINSQRKKQTTTEAVSKTASVAFVMPDSGFQDIINSTMLAHAPEQLPQAPEPADQARLIKAPALIDPEELALFLAHYGVGLVQKAGY
jgi:serine/threonine protein kinase